MWGGINKRRFPRANYKCTILIKRSFFLKHIKACTENIGVGGISVIVKDKIKAFGDVKLRLLLEDGMPPVECNGRVVWKIKRELPTRRVLYDVGFEFTNLKDADKVQIEKIVDKVIKTP